MPFANHDGDKIHYEVFGSGEPLIIQHGLFSCAEDLAHPAFVEAVGEQFQMIFVDSLAHGQSDMPEGPAHYRAAHRAGDITAVLDELGLEKAHYFGYSMGGWIGCAVAQFAPTRLKSFCIGGWPIEFEMSAMRDGDAADEQWSKMKRGLFFDNPRGFQRLKGPGENGYKQCWMAVSENEGAKEAVKSLDCPVLVFCGEQDDMFERVESTASALGKTFLAVPGNHAEAIDQNLGYYFPDIADFFLASK